MKPKKLFILLPDGVGLRNFAFTSFVEMGRQRSWDIVFWNHTPFELSRLGYEERKLKGRPNSFTDLLKRAKIAAELDHFEEEFRDPVYATYKFPPSNRGLKAKFKNGIVSFLTSISKGENGLHRLRKMMKESERRSDFYTHCKKVLEKERPDFVFCTNQRPVNAVAPLTAAQDLGIPTGSFIFSWDNLPKATMVVEPDYYFVWSDHMRQELLSYYPFIKPEDIFVTGSPQFEPHHNLSLQVDRETFFAEHGLEPEREYLCFSGDDKTTSPDDPQYLNDLAEAVENLNSRGHKLGIIFRRCPVDFSKRYDWVLQKFDRLIVSISPSWQQIGKDWNSVLPTKEDLALQINTIRHSKLVVNLASSMVFDFALFGKPCLYLNYEVEHKEDPNWNPQKVYNFVHFRSMPSKEAVLWLNSKDQLVPQLEKALTGAPDTVAKANAWFGVINLLPADQASVNIWEQLQDLV